MDISIREHMIYGDYLKPINTLSIDEEFNSFNKILDSINILTEANIIIEADFSKIKSKLSSIKTKFIEIIKKIINTITTFVKEKIIGKIKKLKNTVLSKLTNINKDKVTDDMVEKINSNGKDCEQKLSSINNSKNNINEEAIDYKQIVIISFNNSISSTVDKIKSLVDDFISQVKKEENSSNDNEAVNNILKIAHSNIGEEYYIDYIIKNMDKLEFIRPKYYENMFNEYENAVNSFNRLKDSLSNIIKLYENEQEDILPYIAIGAKKIVNVINDNLRICTIIYEYLVRNLSILSPTFINNK